MKNNKHIGSSLDSFLESENILSEVEELASCKFLAVKLAEEMEAKGVSISEFARRMGTSRTVAKRVLDPNNTSLTFRTATKASCALGLKLSLSLVEV